MKSRNFRGKSGKKRKRFLTRSRNSIWEQYKHDTLLLAHSRHAFRMRRNAERSHDTHKAMPLYRGGAKRPYVYLMHQSGRVSIASPMTFPRTPELFWTHKHLFFWLFDKCCARLCVYRTCHTGFVVTSLSTCMVLVRVWVATFISIRGTSPFCTCGSAARSCVFPAASRPVLPVTTCNARLFMVIQRVLRYIVCNSALYILCY